MDVSAPRDQARYVVAPHDGFNQLLPVAPDALILKGSGRLVNKFAVIRGWINFTIHVTARTFEIQIPLWGPRR